jgi:hypothetical protein
MATVLGLFVSGWLGTWPWFPGTSRKIVPGLSEGRKGFGSELGEKVVSRPLCWVMGVQWG